MMLPRQTRVGIATVMLWLAALTFGTCSVAHANAAAFGAVRGRVTTNLPGASLSQLGPIVVFLEPVDAPAAVAPAHSLEILQKNAQFSPSFSVVVVGQSIEMENGDAIYHNVFSYSRPNDFDLGIYPAGESRSVTFRVPGVVKTYCSIHENMNGTILVAPTRHYDVARSSGRFEIPNVAPGRYRLHVWCEKLPGVALDVTVSADRTVDLEIPLLGT